MGFSSIEEELRVRRLRKDMERMVEDYFESKGFSLIEPDIFLNYDDFLLSNYNFDSTKTIKVFGGNSKIYVLRPDITLNILGKIFAGWEANNPLKIYYNSKIYSNSPDGSIGQNYQVGVEFLGEEALKADKEIFEIVIHLLENLKTPYVLELASSLYLDSYFADLNLDMKDEKTVKKHIRNKNKHELLSTLNRLGIKGILEVVLDMEGNMEDVINMARKYPTNRDMEKALDYLDSLVDFFKQRNLMNRINLDLSMMPDLDYYDGIVFKGYCQGVAKKIISGGRYDKLTERFGKRVPAVGFMMDMDVATQLIYRGDNQ
ncbi:MAG: hypothetical protein GX231_05375 [Tissierellia bacterium]|nr:hypothetical protein [Tissierellia bacterium]